VTAVSRVRAALVATIVVAATLWGVAAGVLAGPLLGALAAAVVLWRGRHARSIQRVALWIEERAPELQYALVTAVDPRYVATHGHAAAPVNVNALVLRAVIRTEGVALLALAVAIALPARGRASHHGTVGEVSNRLAPLSARVTPPAYARMPAREMPEPSTITALAGSQLVLEGQHDATGLHSTIGTVTTTDGRWQVTATMPAAPAAMRLVDRHFERLIVLQPVADAPPTVVLTTPARDATIRQPLAGTLVLTAEATDDIGLADGDFEYLITSGEEESGGVHAREARIGRTAFSGARTGTLHATLHLDALGLNAGDLLSVRAVVLDGNTVSGPGRGVSETRTIRVATTQESDSLALDAGAPLEVDTADKAPKSNRLYLRGAPPAIVVDVDRVRMRGTETPDAGPRTSGTIPDTLRARAAARFGVGVELLRAPRGSAVWSAGVDSLTMLRVAATTPALAEALNDALTALRGGADAMPALARARRAIDGPPGVSRTLSAWSTP
jgi:hypothetical protein